MYILILNIRKLRLKEEIRLAHSHILSDRTMTLKTKAKGIFPPQDVVCKTKDNSLMYFSNELAIKKKYVF